MAATLFQAPLASVHKPYPLPRQTTPFGRRSSRPWGSAIHDLHLFFDFSPSHNSSKKYDPMHISTATNDIPTNADMAPTTAPLPPSTPPRRDGQPPRLPPLPTSLVPIEGRLVRHRPETHADQVSRLRGPTTAAAAPSRAVRSGGERQQRQTSTLRSTSSRPIDALFDELQAPADNDSLAARLQRRRQRRRSPDPNFTPPRLVRTQPVRTWVTLTGDARAVAAAFGDATDGDVGSGANRSPLRKRQRRTPVVSFSTSTDGISRPSDDVDPVPSTPSVSTPGAGRRRRGGLRRCSSVASEDEYDAATGDAVVTPFLQQTHTGADETTTAAIASSWILPPQRRRLTPPKSPFDAFDFKHDDGENDFSSTSISFLSPERRRGRRGSPSGAGDEPLRSPTEELSALSLGSDEDEMMPAAPPSPCFAENMAPAVAPKRRRGGLTRSMAGRFRMGEGGGLEADCST
ncbi:hypothetical protein DBV05_g2936 [Lasiodiplodia theobromae]|uniref:Uncharacterized protein n=1 Tax=Lasiodiplodia theobromae TaxID=45133 RepID=A0A5N5DKJ5_9PEZI|nr:hypothetical protein DBV05_g2936 [Lasiodiplodia theobromae]